MVAGPHGRTVGHGDEMAWEVQDYWPQRKHLLEILRYLATMGRKLPHWQVDAKAALLLAGAV